MPDDTENLDTAETQAPAETQETPSASTPEGSGDAPATDAAPAEKQDTGSDDSDTSSTTDSTVADEKTDDGKPAQQDYESRYKELQREFTRRSQELKRYRESLGDLDPGEVAERIRKQQEQQQVQTLPPWNPQSPHHGRFSQALQNWDIYRQQIQSAPDDETRKAIGAAWSGIITDEDARAIKAFEQHRAAETQRMVADPGYLQQKLREEAAAVVRQEMAQQSAVMKYQAFFSSPEIAPLVQKHGRALHALMQGGMAAEEAVEYVRSMETTAAKGKVDSDRKVAAAEAQRALAKGQATVSRDKPGQKITDPLAAARKLLKSRNVAETAQSLSLALGEVIYANE